MKRTGWSCLGLIGFLACVGLPAPAQTTLDALEQELNQIKQEDQDMSAQAFSNLISTLEAASKNPNDALDLYQKAGGRMPDAAPVKKEHSYETPNEKSIRVAQDTANVTNLAYAAQMHCGMMRYAVLFVAKPETQGLRNDWAAWLRTISTTYAQATPTDLSSRDMRGSPIGRYLGFRNWDEKEQGGWKVRDLPKLFRKDVLEPLRLAGKPEMLAGWDLYIAMRQADQPDQAKWAANDYPPLAFERATDDFILTPNTEKLSVMTEIIKATRKINPDHPKITEMIARAKELLASLRKLKEGGPAPGITPMTEPTPPGMGRPGPPPPPPAT